MSTRRKGSSSNDARKLWERSPSPKSYGSDEDGDWPMEIVGEEVGYGGEMRYEVAWEGWKRKDGKSGNTTWEGTDTIGMTLPTQDWERRRLAALPDTPDVEIWGTTDIVNTATRERKQGYREYTEQEHNTFAQSYTDVRKRMESLMADKRRQFPQLFAQAEAAAGEKPQVAAGPFRPHVNAEAGPSRPRSSVAAPVASTSRTSTIPPPSRHPRTTEPLTRANAPSHRSPSPALSIVSISSTEFEARPKSTAQKRKATSPPKTASPPPLKRLSLLDPMPLPSKDMNFVRAVLEPLPPMPSRVGSVGSSSRPPLPSHDGTIPRHPLPRRHPPKNSASYPRGDSTSTTASSTAYSFHSPGSRRSTPTVVDSDADLSPPPSLPLRRERGRKRKAPDDDLPRCQCGTLLPPPVGRRRRRPDLCEPCVSADTAKRWNEKKLVEAGSRLNISSKGGNVGNVAISSPMSSVRKGKAAENPKSARLRIETAWSNLAQACGKDQGGAAGITFVNDIDDEEVPPLLSGRGWEFKYLEADYELTKALDDYPTIAGNRSSQHPLAHDWLFQRCECKGADCVNADTCECQDEGTEYAYTDGLFNFKYQPGQVVVECNPYCRCSRECPNRVIQRPRKIPIEVFKTKKCGWGVRAPVDVEKGRMLGVYTGKLIPRAEAIKLEGEAGAYCFDLDYNDGDQKEDVLFSVDSLRYGNWTRFINHSCEPNLRIQPVVYNTEISQNVAFLAFLAQKFIPAGTEFTFDYDPEAQRDFEEGRAELPDGALRCRCGTKSCRGWVRTG